ncbi:hypothetical protein RND81_04G105000 [Saponaria officinalis]|uniref:BHLH domain-containing protein n=1 Tax=Saponaria officinalis TaxID=3572 RepID=A0AAW1LGG6_SAPOF
MDNKFFMDSNIPHQFSSDYFISIQPHIDHFESELSSMVTSPTSNSAISTDNFMIRELIGKIGNICNTNTVPNYVNNGNCSTNNSCYNTPLNSPPKLGKSTPNIDHLVNENFPSLGKSIDLSSNLPAMPGDPGFADRAAKFSSFGSKSFNGRTNSNQFELNNNKNREFINLGDEKLLRVSSSPLLLKVDKKIEGKKLENFVNENSLENSSISTQNQVKENGSCKKRKASNFKGKEIVDENGDDSKAKRSKEGESKSKSKEEEKKEEDEEKEENQKMISEPFKDYIHVRARRGQATDSHSLAERVRREKIGERMKLLQDLVPGCNKVTGKALMLEEIINYVQSLQKQVEFLSMKLSDVNPRLDVNMSNPFSKDAIEPNCSMEHPMYQSMVPTLYGQPQQNAIQDSAPFSINSFNATLNHNHSIHSPLIDGFSNYLSQLPSLCEGDLQSIVQMGFGQKENEFHVQTLHGANPSQMKIEF